MKSSGPPDLELGAEPLLEPVRLLSGASNPFERRLLESAANDRVSAASIQRLAHALNVPVSALPAGLPGELGRTAGLGKYAAFTGFAAFGVIAAIAASVWLVRSAPERTAPSAPLAAVLAVPPRATDSISVVSAAATGRTETSPALAVLRSSAPAATPAVRQRARRGTEEVRPGNAIQAEARAGLRAELAALEAVQSGLRAGRSDAAAQALAEYSRRFPRGELALEAELLGINLALARGEREVARVRARELLARPGGARYRERLEALRIESDSSAHRASEVIR